MSQSPRRGAGVTSHACVPVIWPLLSSPAGWNDPPPLLTRFQLPEFSFLESQKFQAPSCLRQGRALSSQFPRDPALVQEEAMELTD